MSSPIGRSPDPNLVSIYAPKWAQNGETGSDAHGAGDRNIANDGLADLPNLESDNHRHWKSLEPSLVPPMPGSRHRTKTHMRTGNGISSFTSVLLSVAFAAVVGLGLALAWPVIQGFTAAPNAPAESGLKRSDRESKQAAGPLAPAPRPTAPAPALKPAPAQPWPAAQKNASLDPPAHLAEVFNSQTAPTQPTSTGLPWNDPNPPRSPHPNDVPAAAAAPVRANDALASAEPSATEARQTTAPAKNAVAAAPPARANDALASAEPSVTEARQSAATASKARTAAPVTAKVPVRSLSRDQIETLLKQGEGFVSVGDFSSARIVFGRVAEAGDARGALAMAATYDPVALATIGARGATPDEARAREWYRKAKDLGSAKADARLEALTSGAR
jgi:hypothetical protein